MKKSILLYLLLSLGYYSHAQGNLIRNHSFEHRIDNEGDSIPYDMAQVEFLKYWEDDKRDISCFSQDHAIHSPDWYLNESFEYLFPGIFLNNIYISENNSRIPANTGSGHIGMSRCELAQQKFGSNNKFIENKEYQISLFARPLECTCANRPFNRSLCGCASWSSDASLNVYGAKREIRYKNNRCGNVFDDDGNFEEDYCDKRDGPLQDIKFIASFPLSLTDYPPGQWHELKTIFTAPDDSYDWFALEVETDAHDDNVIAHILIDDVVLRRTCEVLCSENGTGGVIDVSFHEHHNIDTPFTIYGLDNVSNLQLKIYSILGQELRTITLDNPPSKLCWDGKDGAGNEVAAAAYAYELVLENDCGQKEIGGDFSKTNVSTNPTPFLPCMDYKAVTKPPDPCCVNHIIIENETLVQDHTKPGPLVYHAVETIETGGSVIVQGGDTVIFKAGDYIDLMPGFDTEDSAFFDALIEPCPGGGSGKTSAPTFTSNEIQADTIEELPEVEDTSKTNDQFTVFPNPTPGHFTLQLPDYEGSGLSAHVSITDLTGRLIHRQKTTAQQLELDLTEQAAGMYIVKVQIGYRLFTEKVVKE